jgi:hypothetical protein
MPRTATTSCAINQSFQRYRFNPVRYLPCPKTGLVNTMKIEHGMFDFHGVLFAACSSSSHVSSAAAGKCCFSTLRERQPGAIEDALKASSSTAAHVVSHKNRFWGILDRWLCAATSIAKYLASNLPYRNIYAPLQPKMPEEAHRYCGNAFQTNPGSDPGDVDEKPG